MASEVGSSMVLFIAAIGVAGLVAGGLTQVVGKMAVEINQQGETLADAIGTDIAIVNDPDNVPYDDTANNLTIYIKNTGSTSLISEELMILVDGEHKTFDTRLLDGASRWSNGIVLEANVTVDLSTGDHTVRAVYTPDISDTLDFRV